MRCGVFDLVLERLDSRIDPVDAFARFLENFEALAQDLREIIKAPRNKNRQNADRHRDRDI